MRLFAGAELLRASDYRPICERSYDNRRDQQELLKLGSCGLGELLFPMTELQAEVRHDLPDHGGMGLEGDA
jgi:hypothetical protein